MKLYSVSTSWRYKGDKKYWHQSVIVLAENAEEARRRFDEECHIPQNIVARGLTFVSEQENGMFICTPRKC